MSESVEEESTEAPAQRPRSRGEVASLFRIADRTELPAAVLVELLGELGMRPAAARRLLARMREDGQLAGRRNGRGVDLRLDGPFGATAERLGSDMASGPPPWSGHFHALLFAVPERERAYRDRLRRVAGLVGYGTLQPGVMISPTDTSADLTGVLDDCPPGARVTRARIQVDAGEAARLAVPAWDLDTVSAVLTGHAKALEAWLADSAPPVADGRTLRTVVERTNPVFVDLIRAPALPPELLPADWPFPRLRRALHEVLNRYMPAAREFVRSRLPPT